jgi:hypothetical protein
LILATLDAWPLHDCSAQSENVKCIIFSSLSTKSADFVLQSCAAWPLEERLQIWVRYGSRRVKRLEQTLLDTCTIIVVGISQLGSRRFYFFFASICLPVIRLAAMAVGRGDLLKFWLHWAHHVCSVKLKRECMDRLHSSRLGFLHAKRLIFRRSEFELISWCKISLGKIIDFIPWR